MSETSSSDRPTEPEGFFTGIRPLAVTVGALMDILSTTVLSVLAIALISHHYGVEPGEISDEQLRRLAADPGMLSLWLFIGTVCTVLGGFTAARMARTHSVKHGAFVGLTGIAMGLLSYDSQAGGPPPPLWFDLLRFAVLVPAGAVGGALAKRPQDSVEDHPSRRDDDEGGGSF